MRYFVGFFTALLLSGAALAQMEPEVKAQFEQLDRNRDGVVTQKEIRQADPEQIRQLHLDEEGDFHEADLNQDGELDEAEFSAFEVPFEEEGD